MKDIAVIADRS